MKNMFQSATALGATAVAALSIAAPACAEQGWYGRADVGLSLDGEADIDGVGEFDLDNDWSQFLGVGYGFGPFRVEGEASHRFNTIEGEGVISDSSDIRVWSGMVNALYDFNHTGAVRPYLGAGIGAAYAEVGLFDAGGVVDDEDTQFAYQGLAGVGLSVNHAVTLDVGYRYFAAEDFEFDLEEVGYEQHTVTFGVRWQYHAAAPPSPPAPPPPAPPPAPPPLAAEPPAEVCVASDFVVYFEWDRSELNSAALETIETAVARAAACNVASVLVVGHTDSSGGAAYNQELSSRRAAVVRDALVQRGVAASEITTQSRGENDLAQATPDGRREPLNRRTAVTIQFQ